MAELANTTGGKEGDDEPEPSDRPGMEKRPRLIMRSRSPARELSCTWRNAALLIRICPPWATAVIRADFPHARPSSRAGHGTAAPCITTSQRACVDDLRECGEY